MIDRKIGRYRVLKKLGEGGLASVWQARDELLGRIVALKILDARWAASSDVVRRFLHEAQATAALAHPGIVTAYDSGEADGLPYIVLACIDGEVLSERARRSLLPIPEAVRIVLAVADALAYAHEHRVIHRDVTGRNIMIGSDSRVYLLDFGLALAAWETRLTRTGGGMGTAPYIAPEVLRGREADARSDLYSLGVVFYEALTGTFPFPGGGAAAMIQRALDTAPVPPVVRRADLPPGLNELVLKVIARDPADRFPDLRAFAAALEHECATGSVLPATASPAVPPSAVAPVLPGGGLPDPLFLVVLPFARSGEARDPEGARDRLADRIADRLRGALAHASRVRVIDPAVAPTAALASEGDPATSARALGANAFLRGEVAQEGSRLRVSFELVDAFRGVHLAGGVADGSAFQVFDLEDDVVHAVRTALALPAAVEATAGATRGSDPAAEEHYLQALASLRRYDNETSIGGGIHLLEQLAGSDADGARVRAALGRAYLYKYRVTKQRVWEARATSAIEAALGFDPGAPEVHLALGDLQAEAGLLAVAVAEYERVLASDPAHFEARLGLARSRLAMANVGAAEHEARAAIDLVPDDWRGHNLLGEVLYHEGRFAEALECWRRVVALSPDNAIGYRNLGGCYHGLGRSEEAIEAFRRSLALQPNPLAYTNLATTLYFLGRYEEAAGAFEKATTLRPADPLLWGNLGNACRWIAGRSAESDRALDRAIALARERLDRNAADYGLWGRLAEWLASRHEAADARHALARALALAPGDLDVIVRAVHVHADLGDPLESLRWMRRAVEQGHPARDFARSNALAGLRGHPEFAAILAARSNGAMGDAP